MAPNDPIKLSAISDSIANSGARSSTEALHVEVYHNLQYQHNWSDLHIHVIPPTSNTSKTDTTPLSSSGSSSQAEKIYLVSGLPPRHTYVHPDFLAHLIKHKMEESDIPVQREWVLPMTTGEKWSLRRICQIFDSLPQRDALTGISGFIHQDAKRVLCGIKGHDGVGGDGTVVYYIMQEGEVKPRQN